MIGPAITRKVRRRFIGFAVTAALCLLQTPHTDAALVPAGGVDAGIARVEHAVFGYAGANAAAAFNGFFDPAPATGGALITPGFGYPAIGGAPVFINDTGKVGLLPNVPITWTTAAQGAPSNFGGATTRLVGVGGAGRAGVAVTNFALSDGNPNGGGVASTNTFAASVVYTNTGVAFNARFAQFLAANVNLAPGGLAMAGVKSVFEVGDYNPVTGGFAVDTFWEPAPILLAFDGLGPKADQIQAQFFNFAAVGNALTFSAVSTTPALLILPGKSVRIRGTVSLVADPAAFDIIDLPPDMQANLNGIDLAMGDSSNSEQLVPEPSSVVLLALGSLIGACSMARRRAAGKK